LIIDLTDENYVQFVEKIDKPFFIDFYTPMCGACQQIEPYLDDLASYYEDQATICRCNARENPKLAKKYQISSVPLCLVIGNDKKVKSVEAGAKESSRYFEMLDEVLEKKSSFLSSIFGILGGR
jgi:thioredoxin 1